MGNSTSKGRKKTAKKTVDQEQSVREPWDSAMKTLVHTNPEGFVKWLVPDGRFMKEKPTEFTALKRDVDVLLEIMVGKKRMLLHIEFQTYRDTTMPERLMEYHVMIRRHYGLPVKSYAIFLVRDGKLSQPPLEWDAAPIQDKTLIFYYNVLRIADLKPEDLYGMQILALLPLLPLTKGGTQRKMIEMMFERLSTLEQKEASLIGFQVASFVLKSKPAELEWLQRRYRNMYDIFKDSPAYHWILDEGVEKGRKEGLEEGFEKGLQHGQMQAMRIILENMVKTHFPMLLSLAQKQSVQVSNAQLLGEVTLKISVTDNEEEAQKLLTDLTNSL